jgi:hypothetical protein
MDENPSSILIGGEKLSPVVRRTNNCTISQNRNVAYSTDRPSSCWSVPGFAGNASTSAQKSADTRQKPLLRRP